MKKVNEVRLSHKKIFVIVSDGGDEVDPIVREL